MGRAGQRLSSLSPPKAIRPAERSETDSPRAAGLPEGCDWAVASNQTKSNQMRPNQTKKYISRRFKTVNFVRPKILSPPDYAVDSGIPDHVHLAYFSSFRASSIQHRESRMQTVNFVSSTTLNPPTGP